MATWDFSGLIYAWLHGHLGQTPLVPPVERAESDPQPSPWKGVLQIGSGPNPWRAEISVAASLMSAISLKVAAARVPNNQNALLISSMDARIGEIIDDYCGTPPRSPWPGPSPQSYGLAAGLTFLAGTLPEESKLQAAVAEVVARVLEKINKV